MFHIPTERKLAESSEEFVALAGTLLVCRRIDEQRHGRATAPLN